MSAGAPTRLRAVAFAAAVLAGEVAAVVLAWKGEPWSAAGLHAAVSLLALAAAWRQRGHESSAGAALDVLAAFCPFLGPVAALGTLLTLILTRPPAEDDDGDLRGHLFPRIEADPIERQVAGLRHLASLGTADQIVSFRDVLRWGTLAQAEHVIALMSRDLKAGFAELFREALDSAKPGIRAQAAAGMALLDARMAARTLEFRRSLAEMERGPARDAVMVALARHLDDVANAGLVDEQRAAEFRRETVGIYRTLLDQSPTDAALGAVLGRNLLVLGQNDLAREVLSDAVEVGLDTQVAFGWLAECHHRNGDHDALQALVRDRAEQARRIAAANGPLAPAMKFWLQEA